MTSTEHRPRKYKLTSRASKLAIIQTNFVLGAFQSAYPTFDFVASFDWKTLADRNQTLPLWQLARQNKGIFSEELEEALKDEKVDLAVHCLKDLPTQSPEGLELAAILEKEDPADCLVVKAGLTYKSLDELPDGSVVGTSSVRRTAQLKRSFPKLKAMVVVSVMLISKSNLIYFLSL
jgi:hydroxymethylbilane synthase